MAREGRTTDSAGPGLVEALGHLAQLHGLAAPLATALAGAAPKPRPAALLRVARKAGLRCRRLRVGWTDLARLSGRLPGIAVLRDGSALILVEIRDIEGTSVAVLQDPRRAEGDPVVVDRIRFEQAWRGELVLVRPRRASQASRSVGWRKVAALARAEPRLLRDAAAATVALGLLAAAPILFAQLLLQRVLPAKAEHSLLVLSIAVLVAVLAEAVFRALRGYLVARLAAHTEARLSAALFDRLLGLPPTALRDLPLGDALGRMGELRTVRATLFRTAPRVALDAAVLVLLLPLMVVLNLPLTLLFLLIVAGGIVVLYGTLPKLRRAGERLAEARAARDAFLVQSLAGMQTIKSLALAPDRMRRWDRLSAGVAKSKLDEARRVDVIAALSLPLERVFVPGLLAIGIGASALLGNASELAPLLGFTLLVQRVIAPLPDVAVLLRARGAARIAMARLGALVDRPLETSDPTAAHATVVQGAIAFENVRFRYPDAATPALRGATFSIAPGMLVGVMGRSGAGKTTLARLLQRLRVPQAGTIRLDGLDIAAFDLHRLRRAVALVPQTSTILAGTIRETITAGKPDATFEDMTRAASQAGLTELIDRLPRGFETRLADGAPSLSAGQRQRLALARALITDPKILILDEALSALDAEIEATVEANLREARRGRTTIVITHRLSSLVACDTILVMADGEVRDAGRHHELLERSDIYATAWSRQQGALEGDGDGVLALT